MASGTEDCIAKIVDFRDPADIVSPGPQDWDGDVTDDGHQTFSVTFIVEVCDPQDGPWTALQCTELPACGEPWSHGNDDNPYAYAGCARKAKRFKMIGQGGDPGTLWQVTIPYSTKAKSRCCDTFFDDPLNEPVKESFEVETEKEEALENWDGTRIETSSHEVIRGPQNEWDRNDFKVSITQNLIDPQLPLLVRFYDKAGAVNDDTLWGFSAGCVRLCAPLRIEPDYYGTCYKYYKRTLTFHIKASGHDRYVVDEGTKALSGHWGTGQGSGCTIAVTVNAQGGILTATLGAGGAGYPRSATIFLVVSGGTGGVVKVRTNSNGVCISDDLAVDKSGSDYTAGTLGTSGGGSGWILDNVTDPCDGSEHSPDPDNPADFARYVDRTGNPATVILDGFGLPYSPCNDATLTKWWCINDGISPYVTETNCQEAVQEGLQYGPTDVRVQGPYDSEGDAIAACDAGDFPDAGSLPTDVVCPDSGPGQVPIFRCQPQDLTLLGIPLVIGGP